MPQHDMPPKSRKTNPLPDSHAKKSKSFPKSVGDSIERGVTALGRALSGKPRKEDDVQKREKGSRGVLPSRGKQVSPKSSSRKAVRTSSGATKKKNIVAEVPQPAVPRRIERLRKVEVTPEENARRVAQRRMIVEGINSIGKEYTEQDVRNVLASTRMYELFPHMMEGETRAEAEPLEDDEGFFIDGMVMPDDSSERETERAARRQTAPQSEIGNPSEPEYYDVEGEDTPSEEEEDTQWPTSGFGVAGPSKLAQLRSRDDSSMKSAFSADSARHISHATEATPGPSRIGNPFSRIGLRFGKTKQIDQEYDMPIV